MFRSLVLLLCLAAGAALAQTYPARSVKIIVPFGVGGSADVYARILGAKLSDALGHPFVVENRPGAGAIVGSDLVAKSAPDGYTLLMMSNTHTVNETLVPKKPYDLMKDLTPITGVNSQDLLLAVNPSLPASNLKELIALAKSKPGKLNYASSGTGTPYHLAGELFKSMAGVDIVHVPHKGSDQARVGLLGNQVDMMFDAISTIVAHVRSSKLKGLATTGKARSPVTPDIPTVSEAGVPGYEATIWLGLMAPAGTPREVLAKLNGDVQKVLSTQEIRDTWSKEGAAPMGMSIEQFDKFLRADIAKWAAVIKATGMKQE